MAVKQKPNASNKNVEISAYNIDLLNEPTDFICGLVCKSLSEPGIQRVNSYSTCWAAKAMGGA